MKGHTDHRKRLITGAAGIVAVGAVVGWASPPVFFLCVLAIIAMTLKEYHDLCAAAPVARWVGTGAGVALASAFFFLPPVLAFVAPAAGTIAFCLSEIRRFQPAAGTLKGKETVLGILTISFMLAHLIWIRALPHGQVWLFYLCAVVFAGDVCALYGGLALGRHQLAPVISPQKTVEGAVCGLAGSCLGGGIFSLGFFPASALGSFLVLAALMGAAGQIGDLWESTLKRRAKVKDSGAVLPGHGGVFDRLDSILLTVPVLYYYAAFREGLW